MKTKLFAAVAVALLFSGCQKAKEIIDSLDPDSLHNRAAGDSARELLRAEKYKSLRVEVQYMPGFVPDANALQQFKTFLESRINKPGGVTVLTKEISASANATMTAEEVHAIEKANRSVFSSQEELALYILYTNGTYTENNVLGIAYRNTSAALFGKRIRDNSGGVGQVSRTKLEATVLNHEAGHLLGLVDVGTSMQTAHKANGNHCNNQNCLMHYASETTDVLGFLLTGNVPPLDAACEADLRATGGK